MKPRLSPPPLRPSLDLPATKKKPDGGALEEPEPGSFDDPASVLAYENEVRVYRGYSEAFHVELLLGGPSSSTRSFAIAGSSGGSYVVDLVGKGDKWVCSCPDFIHGRLGTCKHVWAIRRVLSLPKRKRRGVDLPAAASPYERSVYPSVAPDDGSLSLRLSNSGAKISAAEARAGDARITASAREAIRVIEQREQRARRRSELAEAITQGRIGVDVLSSPLFPYQREGVAHLVRSGRAVLADDMGLGKTVQTIAACEVLRRRGEAKRVLIVCPASLKAQWATEITRYAGAQSVVIVGTAATRRAAFLSDAPYVILNYELTWRDLTILKTLETDVLVLDEAQRAKNFRTKTAATLRSIPSELLFVLTGTPVENRLDDLYSILQLVDPGILGPLWQFNLKHVVRDTESGRTVAYKNLGELRETIAPVVLRRRKEEVLAQLPPLTEQTRYVALSDEQKALEKTYRQRAAKLAAISAKRRLRPDEMKELIGLFQLARRVCNAAVLCDAKTTEGSPAKIEELGALVSEISQQGGSKVLVFSEWTDMLKLAATKLDALGIGYLLLHGSVPTPLRPALIDSFRADPEKVVLLSTDAGGLGLNLQVASYVIHLDLPWNPARLDQRTARAHRLGQTRGVSVTYLCAETGIERGIEGTLSGKRAVGSAAIDLDSDIDTIDAPTFSQFIREAVSLLGVDVDVDVDVDVEIDVGSAANDDQGARVAVVVDDDAADDVDVDVVEEVVIPTATPAPPSAVVVQHTSSTDDLRATEAFARQRLRLAYVVLAAGFPGDAVTAAYEALAASIRARAIARSLTVGDDHASLLQSIHRDLLPSGVIPSTLPATIAKVHDLSISAAQGLPVDMTLATEAVEEARAWLERADTFAAADRQR